MSEASYLREQARACWKLAKETTARETAEALKELALNYEWRADCIEEREQGLRVRSPA